MSSSAASQGASISQHLRAIKNTLRGVVFGAKIAPRLDAVEFDVLEQDAFDVLLLIRSWKNMVAPINKIPPEILALVPGFLDRKDGDRGLIALTHVCRAWREVFVSRSSLWVDFDCKNWDKTRVYLERSKTSPINLSLHRTEDIPAYDPFLWIIPRAIGRLKSLSVEATPENLQTITHHLSHPAPLLEHLTIDGNFEMSEDYPTLTSALFNGDLSSLRTLNLEAVRTELPWRNMVNLTSFTLAHILVSVKQFLDFFESAPHLCKVDLHNATPTTGPQNGRLVSLACLKSMYIGGGGPSSILLEHLVIPVGAKLTTAVDLHDSLIGEHLPKSLGNLRNLSNFTTIRLLIVGYSPSITFSGPNGEVTMIPTIPRTNRTRLVLESLAQFDTSKVKQLEICRGGPLSIYSIHQALLPMVDLRTLTLSGCMKVDTFIHALRPCMNSPDFMLCPTLEKLVLVGGEKFDVTRVIEVAALRALGGKKLGTIEIVNGEGVADPYVSELRKHVWNVECGLWSVPSMTDSSEED